MLEGWAMSDLTPTLPKPSTAHREGLSVTTKLC